MPTPHRIDVHHHFVPQVYKDALVALGSACPSPGYQPPLQNWTEARTIDQMDQAAIASAMISVTTPGIFFGDVAAMIKLARQCNDAGAKMVADKPQRFGLFAAIPLPDVDAALKEMTYALDQLKADGIGFYTNYDAGDGVKYLGDAKFARNNARRRHRYQQQRNNEGQGPRKVGAVHRQRFPLMMVSADGGKGSTVFWQRRARSLLCRLRNDRQWRGSAPGVLRSKSAMAGFEIANLQSTASCSRQIEWF